MKNILYPFLLIVAFAFLACADDNTPEQPIFQAKDFQGEWFCQENFTFLDISFSNFRGTRYSNLETGLNTEMNITGRWVYYPSNHILRMDIHYTNSSETRDYKILKVDSNTLTFVDLQFNTQYVYHKVVGECELAIGDTFDMNNIDLIPSSFSSLNPHVVDVDNQGHVIAHNTGTAFVCAESVSDKNYMKIDVIRIPCYLKELWLSIDDIIAKYGTPDNIILYDEEDPNSNMMAIYKTPLPDTGLGEIQYVYDQETREITLIYTYYMYLAMYSDDVSYVKDNFYDIMLDGSLYGEYVGMIKNNYYISHFYTGESAALTYYNQIYLRLHGHF
ncbi:MAG: hypothetical protein IKD75_12245 [Prevotella sp.]|nr:hypothetical protein [Prevotella sp.]